MRTRAQTVRLGIFIAIALGLLLGTLLVLSGTAYFRQRDYYKIVFDETVSGLEVGAAVKLLGVRVGRIESFRVRTEGADKIEVTVSLDHGTPIRSNAEAHLSGSGLTGLLFVEITGGTADAELIEPGERIPAGPSLLGTLTGKAENIAIKTEEVLNRILRVTEDRNLENLRVALDNVQVATRNARNVLESLDGVSNRFGSLMDEISAAATSMRAAGTTVHSVATDARKVTANLDTLTAPAGAFAAAVEQLQRTLATADAVLGGDNAAQTAQEVRNALRSFTETMNNLSTIMGSSARDVQEVSSSLRDAAEHLEEFARAIRENPSLLIRTTEGE